MFEARVAELEALAQQHGLDFFRTSIEVVPQDIMTEVAAYGLPTRARHWSYGKVYQSQRLYGTMGLSKIYFFFQAEDGIRDVAVTGVQTCALPISRPSSSIQAATS